MLNNNLVVRERSLAAAGRFDMSEKEVERTLDFALVVDSTTVIDPEVSDLLEVQKVPLYITLGKETRPEPEWTIEEIVAGYDTLPCKTACPSAGEFESCFEKLLDEGYKGIVCIPMTKGVSGTYLAARMAKESLKEKGENIHIVDVALANYGVTTLLNASVPYLKKGIDAKGYAEKLEKLAHSSSEIWTLGSLDHLYKGGRLSKFSFAIGNLLHIKPIIGVSPETGGLDVEKKVRTFSEVDSYMINRVKDFYERFKRVYVRFINLGDEDQAANLKARVLEACPRIEWSSISEVGPLFTVHLGRNGYGLCCIGDGPIASKMDTGAKSWLDILRIRKQK